MKSFKVQESKVVVDGVMYSQSPSETTIMGKMGRIHSIMIEGRGQFFPLSGVFNDGTIPVVDSTTDVLDTDGFLVGKKKRAKATKMVEESGEPLDSKGYLIGKKKKAKK